ncbi:peptidoglycan D,D-transpeptidase FtsI family protein [Humidisolicoccus flavus]|uniref:peptidoglycan D,D-transpeptidase FtsI family protein n=1 Tax=Humidisolicoccus flavus TaxID=3111414 RepID=UPI0032540F48
MARQSTPSHHDGSKPVVSPRTVNARAILAIVIVLALVGVFVVRLADIQIVQAEALNAEADSRRTSSAAINGARGDIVDMNGTVLAGSVDRWNITISPQYALDEYKLVKGERTLVRTVGEALVALGEITGDDPYALQEKLNTALEADENSDYLMLIQQVDAEQYDQIRALGIPWVYPRLQPARIYPNGNVAGNLVGFMGTDDPLAGLELSQNECLSPTAGSQSWSRGRDGTVIPGSVVVDEPAHDGGTLELTLDADLQYQVQQYIAEAAQNLGAPSATAIIAKTSGELLAVADYPSVDSNRPTSTASEYRGANSFMMTFEPGSIFKTVSMAVMLDMGIITPTSEVVAPGRITLPNGVSLGDAHWHPDMQWTATGVLVQSSNTGITQLGYDMDRTEYMDYLAKFGFGEQTNVGFNGESAARLRDAGSLDLQTQSNMLFGQGIAVTPMQMVSAYQALGNGGVHEPLKLVSGCALDDGTVIEPEAPDGHRVISEQSAEEIVNMMEYVVTDYGYQTFPVPGYRVAAKTGTAQVAYLDGSGYDPESMIITTAGVFPAEDPEYVVYVQINKPQTVRTSAGAIPVFHDLVSLLIRQYDIPPSTEARPDIPLEWPSE